MKQDAAFAKLNKSINADPKLQGLFIIDLIRRRDIHNVFSGAWQDKLVLIKHFIGETATENALAAYTESTDRAAVLNGSRFQVAEPLYLAKTQGLFISQFVEGDTMFDLLKSGEPAEPLYKAAGEWFAAYTHDRQRRSDFKPTRWLKRANEWPPNPNGLTQAMLDRLDVLAQRLDGHSIRQGRVHGDLTTANLMWVEGTIVGIDIANQFYLALCKDLGRFLAQGEAFQSKTNGLNPQGLPQTRTKALIDGFGALEPVETDALLPFFYGWELLQFSRHMRTEKDALNYTRAMDAFLSVV